MENRKAFLDQVGSIGSHWVKNKNVLVTGASGFIGAALTDALIYLGARVYVLSLTVDFRQPLFGSIRGGEMPLAWGVEKIIHGDLRHRTDCLHTIAIAEPDFVFHLGALTQVTEASREPINTFLTNALGTLHLLEACRRVGRQKINVIVASSDKAYGKPLSLPLKEDDYLNPIHPYDLSKACGDMAARSHAHYYGTRVQVTRLANVYGPGDTNWKRLIPGMIRWMMEGNQPIVRSDGKQVRQYLFIADAVTAYLMLARAMDQTSIPNGQAWNFAPADKHSVMEIVFHLVGRMTDRGYHVETPKILGKAKDETLLLELDNFNTKAELGWEAMTPIGKGLDETIDWVLRYFNMEQTLK